MKKALIVVDVQNDFCPGGNLAVKDGDKIIPEVNKLINSDKFSLVVATQDFHPQDHSSFVSNNPAGIWPDHCVQGTKGADFHPDLDTKKIKKVFPKGTNKEVDSYSGFLDNDKKSSTGLGEYLKAQGIEEVEVVGLALDYCVKATALDAVAAGLKTSVNLKATAAVNIKPEDGFKAIKELIENGVLVTMDHNQGE